ncbi:MAG: hypothetical protein AAFZ92_06825, partial [Pseudomonadota bacterium]
CNYMNNQKKSLTYILKTILLRLFLSCLMVIFIWQPFSSFIDSQEIDKHNIQPIPLGIEVAPQNASLTYQLINQEKAWGAYSTPR